MSIAQDNRAKYLKPPTFEEIDDFRKLLGVRVATFERFFGITVGTINKIKKGERDLPANKWHIIYEKVKPAYGSGFLTSGKKLAKNKAKNASKPTNKKPSNATISKLSALEQG